MNPTGWLRSLVRQPLPSSRWHRAATLLLFFAGATLGLSFLSSIASWPVALVAAAVATALYAAFALPTPTRWRRVAAVAAAVPTFALHAVWIYLAVVFGSLLAWAVSPSHVAAVGLLIALVIATAHPAWKRVRVPVALPLGAWIVACLAGWLREEGFVRCDDVLRVRREPAVSLILATSADEEACVPRAVLPIARFPRKSWEAPEGDRYVITTFGGPGVPRNALAPGRLPGGVCEVLADGSAEPRCVGFGKVHGIIEAPELDRLFAFAYGFRFAPHLDGIVYELTRTRPLELVREVRVRSAVHGFYEPTSDLLGTFSDEGFEMVPFHASTLTPLPSVPTPAIPDEVRYDASRHEGVICFAAGPLRTIEGGAFLAVALRGVPYAFRPLAPSASYPSSWLSLSWGCDWDPRERRVYATVANLGALAMIDYDTGQLLARHFVGFGMRSVAFDARRRRLYLANFLRGDVDAIDVDSGARVARWFVGRFVRDVRLTRSGDALLVTSNVGLLRIGLE